jgi:hypothetical protein
MDSLLPPRPKKTRAKFKSMLIVLFGSKGIIDKDFVQQGQNVAQQYYYKEFLRHLRNDVRGKRPDK